MRIGLFSTFMSPLADAVMVRDLAQRAEGVGVESLWLGEHVVLFDEMEFPYPGSADGRIPVPEGGGLLDVVATFGFLAAVTDTMRFGTGIALISQRNPIYTAKEFATLDWLSGGRIDFGIGVGWCKEEVLASGYTWHDRGARADEFLEVVTRMWTDEYASFDGEHFRLAPCRADPKPVQRPHVPIHVGGHGAAAMRRTARFGQGWYGFQLTVEQTAPILDALRAELAPAGRTLDELMISITPPTIDVDTVARYADLGVDRLILHLGSQRPNKIEQRLDEVGRLIEAVDATR